MTIRGNLRVTSALVCAASAGVVGSVAVAGPATAYEYEYQHVKSKSWTTGAAFCVANGTATNHSAVGCFGPVGDYIQPGDLKKDGKRVGVQWKTDYGRRGTCVNARGKDARLWHGGSGSPAQGKHMCNKNFREKSTVSFRVGTCNGSKVDCGKIGNWGQWTPWIKRKANA